MLSHTLFIKLQYLLAKNFLFLLSLGMQTMSSDVISVNWMLVQNVSQKKKMFHNEPLGHTQVNLSWLLVYVGIKLT